MGVGEAVARELPGVYTMPLRKEGKLPGELGTDKIQGKYEKEYKDKNGQPVIDILEASIHHVEEGSVHIPIDDVLATGGTSGMACELINRITKEHNKKCTVDGFITVTDVPFHRINARKKLAEVNIDPTVVLRNE